MVKIRASCSVVGKNFSPADFSKRSRVKLHDANEPGSVGHTGVYRGKPMPYGSASIQVSDKSEEDWSRFDELLTLMESCIDALRDAGAEELTLHCSLFHDGQCNFGFSQTQLRRIAALKVDMPISCYSDEID